MTFFACAVGSCNDELFVDYTSRTVAKICLLPVSENSQITGNVRPYFDSLFEVKMNLKLVF